MNPLIASLFGAISGAGSSSTSAAPRGRRLRRSSQLLSLEQRFMFDGAVADAAHAAQAHETAPLPVPVPPAVTVRAAEPARDDGKKEVVLVDTSLANYKSLESGVRDGVGIVEFDGSGNGLAQIAQWAASQSGLDAIHILSHGSEGVVNLGSDALTAAALSSATTQAELAQLGHALNTDGDLLLYGCDVAAGADGAQLLAGIARATGADVAASTDLTGAARLGGNWTLEAHSGVIDIHALAPTNYDGALSTINFAWGVDGDDFGADIDGNGNASTIGKVESVSGKTITFTGDELYIPIDSIGLYALTADHSAYVLTVSAPSGHTFDLNSVQSSAFADLTVSMLITYGDGSTANPNANVVGDSSVHLVTLSLNDIKSVQFTALDYVTFQDFVITDVRLAPPAAVVATAHLASDTGTSNTDFITSVAAQTISGTLSTNLGSGERVEISYDNGSSWSNATSYTVGLAAWSTTTTLAGSNTFEARVSNADASSTAYTHSYTLDTTSPTTTFTNIALSADTGSSSSDLITKTAAQTITATLSGAPAGTDVVWGSVDSGAHWTDITSKVSGTTLTWTGATLAGTSAIMFKVTDAAGNDSALSFQNYTLDTTAPTHSVATATFSNDSGTSSTDFVTSVAAQTISGTLSGNLSSGETVQVSLDNGSTWANATATVGQSTWSLARTLTASSTLKVKVSDTAGNDGAVLSQAYVYDTTAPTITFNSLALSADTGASNSDFITKTSAQTISATLSGAPAGGDIVYGSLDNGSTWTNITSKVSGTTLSWNGVTLAGVSTLLLKVTDAAGNDGTVRNQAYTLDTTAPATPGTPVLTTASDTGASNSDGVTADNTPTLSGTAENGSTVMLYDGATLLGTVTAGAGGWTTTSSALSEGSHTITATATDAAGNVSADSGPLNITIDTTAPTVTSVAVPANGTYYSGGALDFTVNFDEAVVVDGSGGTPRIAIVVGATVRHADFVSGSGTSALVFRYTVPNGDIDANGITVGALAANGGSVKDSAGNNAVTTLNSVGSTAGIDVDGTNPSITGVSASTADGAYGAGQTIIITVDFSGAVSVDTSGGTPTLALDGGGAATYTGGSGGSTLTFNYTVGAGENSADLDYSSTNALALNGATVIDAGGAHQPAALTLATPGTAGSLGANKDIAIDTAAPTNTVAGAAFSADTGSSNSDFITRTAAQAVSGTLASNLAADEHVYVSLDNGGSWALATASTGANTWSLAGQTLTGSGTLKVRVTDDAGNNGSGFSQAYVLDTTAPTISFSGIAFSADTGASNTDLVTNTAAQTIGATLSAAPAAGDTVYGSLDNGGSWIDITSKVSGTTLSWNGVTLAASDTLKLRVTDAAGNNGAATSAAYVLDTSGPATSVASVAFSADSGASGTDFITRTAAQTVSGTLSANLAAGESVLVSLDNGATWATAAATVGSSTWSLAGQTLTASDTLQVKVADVAGNNGAVLSQAYVYDTAATVPTVAALSTTSFTPTLTGTATLAAGETMTVTVGGATYDVVPVAGNWSLDLATAVPTSGALVLVLNHQYDVAATVTDLAGNTGHDSTNGELIVGTIAPPPPPPPPPTAVVTTAITGAALSNDSGASNTDFITNIAAQTISGNLSASLVAGDTVLVSLDNGRTWATAAAQVGASSWSLAGATLAASSTLQVKVSNAGVDGAVFARAYVLDTTAPAAATVAAQTTGSLVPTLGGGATLAAGESMTVAVGGATYSVTPVAGAWSLDLSTATPISGKLALALNNRYDVVATVTDTAGNVSTDTTSAELSLVSSRPQQPTTVVNRAVFSNDSGASGSDFITNSAAQTISGTLSAGLAAGERVEVSLDGGTNWRTAAAVAGATSWSLDVTLPGSGTLAVRVTGAGGSSTPYQQAYVVDTAAPTNTIGTAFRGADGSATGTLSAPLAADETLQASSDGGSTWTTVAVGAGRSTWSLTGDANVALQLRVTDLAGNSGAARVLQAQTALFQTPPVVPEPPPQIVLPPTLAQPGLPAQSVPLPPLPSFGIVDTPQPETLSTRALQPDAVLNGGLIELLSESATPLRPAIGGDALAAGVPVENLAVHGGDRIAMQLDADAFAHNIPGESPQLSAELDNGEPLPSWLVFNAREGRFEGTAPAGFTGTITVRITARDGLGHEASQVFKIVIDRGNRAQAPVTDHPAVRTAFDAPAGRSSLSQQLRDARGAHRLAALAHSAGAAVVAHE